jgi:hypothetical protein
MIGFAGAETAPTAYRLRTLNRALAAEEEVG